MICPIRTSLKTGFLLTLAIFILCFSCKKKEATHEPEPVAEMPVFVPLQHDSDFVSQFLSSHSLFAYHAAEVQNFYRERNYGFAWFNEKGLLEQGNYFINLLNHFDDQGIHDSVIYESEVLQLTNAFTVPDYSFKGADSLTRKLDVLLTAEFFVYAQKVWSGVSEQKSKDLSWYITRKTISSVAVLDSILSGGKSAFTAKEPVYKQYQLLRNYLHDYKTLEKHVTWDSVTLPEGIKFLKQGDSSWILIDVKQKLFWLGDLPERDTTIYFDTTLTAAVKKFQQRFGLKPDGSIGANFIAELDVPIAKRIRQIEINMERCRWVPIEPKGNYIYVNIPEYRMHIYENNKLAWDMNVVVGKASTSTVIFNDELEYIVFSPYWTPPPSIVSAEILPALKKNPGYLASHDMEALSNGKVIDPSTVDWSKYKGSIPYTIRQKPGNSNSLGWVKFIFPNEHNIYFHDTSSRSLFNETNRGFSHGCIRLAEPERFADYLLRNDTAWTTKKIHDAMFAGKEKYVKLQEKTPVFIAYFTAWVDENGNINFRKDIYGHDAKLEEAIFTNK